MSAEAAKALTPMEQLRAPFKAEQIGKLPRVTCRDCSGKNANCGKHQRAKCNVCGAFVSTAHIHLDYVGHAAVTDRLLAVDSEWSWEPCGFTPEGLPATTVYGTEAALWVKLTVGGVTRYGVGTAVVGSFELPKQLISDAIRNAAMRFGVALDLWSKEDLHADDSANDREGVSGPHSGVDHRAGMTEPAAPSHPDAPNASVDVQKRMQALPQAARASLIAEHSWPPKDEAAFLVALGEAEQKAQAPL